MWCTSRRAVGSGCNVLRPFQADGQLPERLQPPAAASQPSPVQHATNLDIGCQWPECCREGKVRRLSITPATNRDSVGHCAESGLFQEASGACTCTWSSIVSSAPSITAKHDCCDDHHSCNAILQLALQQLLSCCSMTESDCRSSSL